MTTKMTKRRRARVEKHATLSEFQAWIEMVPADTRQALARVLQKQKIEGFMDYAYFCQLIISEILAGNIPPAQADAARGWGELMFTAIAAERSKTGSPGETFAEVVTLLKEAADEAKEVKPVYYIEAESREVKEEAPVKEKATA